MEVKLEVTSEETKPLEVKSEEIKPVEFKLEVKSEETKPLEKEDPGFTPDWVSPLEKEDPGFTPDWEEEKQTQPQQRSFATCVSGTMSMLMIPKLVKTGGSWETFSTKK